MSAEHAAELSETPQADRQAQAQSDHGADGNWAQRAERADQQHVDLVEHGCEFPDSAFMTF